MQEKHEIFSLARNGCKTNQLLLKLQVHLYLQDSFFSSTSYIQPLPLIDDACVCVHMCDLGDVCRTISAIVMQIAVSEGRVKMTGHRCVAHPGLQVCHEKMGEGDRDRVNQLGVWHML